MLWRCQKCGELERGDVLSKKALAQIHVCKTENIRPMLYRCPKCRRRKPLTAFSGDVREDRCSNKRCRVCTSTVCIEQQRRAKLSDPRYRMWRSSYASACQRGLEHTIKLEDIPLPRTCAYLGVELIYNLPLRECGDSRITNAPTIDRIDNTKGYILGNIQVISDLANRMKTNATVEQLLAFAYGVIEVHG